MTDQKLPITADTKNTFAPISPSIHEGVIQRHFATDPATRDVVFDPLLEGMADAMQTLRLNVEKAKRVAQAIFANEMETIPARHKRVKEESWRATQAGTKAIDAIFPRAQREIEMIEQKISAPPRPADSAGHMLATEIRSRLSAMKPADRKKAIDAAMADGDDTVLGAVLNAPPILSGVGSNEEMAMLRTRWQRARHGADVNRLERIKQAMDDLTRAGTIANSYTARLANSKIIDQAEAKAQAVKDAISGAIAS
ncbi:hypothetical protein [Phyllobacterium endophyticum]|uniref:Uncharacterized protein n=1 Tax=Phyllobacterium endophyticum TaxID=1149773 RepID=A0A2P7ALP0_9HYPH|nr:hypothetical protein [Phyllobacterium endophyticum]MBB3236344.1 hypothetical protein [Phyllobacterium endophyticum]PSH55115.1 hypothetical protein CU100_23820 [Phyllobacterium endophyticum]TYR39882.1 hypothetical protein FY050_19870 [Phyllobacterium endophyticum]